MRKYAGLIVILTMWIAVILGLNIWFKVQPTLSPVSVGISAAYMFFLLLIIPIGLPLHSRGLEIGLMIYALCLGVLDVALFVNVNHLIVRGIGRVMLAPFQGLFFFKDILGMGNFTIYAAIGCFAAFLTLAAGVGACMVQSRE